MVDEDRGNDKPSLELPSLRFGRKRKRAAEEAPAPDAQAPDAPAPVPEPAAVEPTPTEPVPSVPADETPTALTPPPATAEPVPSPDAPPLFADEVAPTPLAPPTPPAAAPVVETAEPAAQEQPTKPARVRRQWSLPAIGGMAAAMITGVLVGVFTVGLVWASMHLCEVVRGTSSCGGPGYLLLLGIVVAMVLLGAVLLRAWGLPDPSATSFLAVGLMGVLALLMVDLLFNWWMIIVIPAIAAATFALAHRLTASFTEPSGR
ncbi:hypothetical protein [Nocardioides ungokensis]|uniref:hypothetical protein n=1 Tax=Nocardioides ungokensis TaxID=1643322 RepID=UPI0015DECF51|nr:hypothetical protein [Nocardioides ungokensis]